MIQYYIFGKMIIAKSLTNVTIHSYKFFLEIGTFKIYLLSKFPICSTELMVVTTQYLKSPGLMVFECMYVCIYVIYFHWCIVDIQNINIRSSFMMYLFYNWGFVSSDLSYQWYEPLTLASGSHQSSSVSMSIFKNF